VTSMIPVPDVVQRRHRVVIGVDTHKYVHVAVALDEFGGIIDSQRFAADRAGYAQLTDWAVGLGRKLTFAIEGTVPTVLV
jgi:transposase